MLKYYLVQEVNGKIDHLSIFQEHRHRLFVIVTIKLDSHHKKKGKKQGVQQRERELCK